MLLQGVALLFQLGILLIVRIVEGKTSTNDE
jgi:uncharacterized membrane protein